MASTYELKPPTVERAEYEEMEARVALLERTITTLANHVATQPMYLRHRFVDGAAPLQGSSFMWDNARKMWRPTTYLVVADGVTAPTAVTGEALIYVDTADGDLKCRFGDGFTRLLGADS